MIRKNRADRWALLIGIDKYTNLPAYNQLEGCVNDVEAMSHLLQESFDFPADHITMLRDIEASRTAILRAVDTLIQKVGEDDIAVIQYSGHGSQMRDREGDEPDGWDETIVPSDSGRDPQPNRDISDDEIYERLLALGAKTPNIALIFDSCHSGSIARDAFGCKSRWIPPDQRPIDALPQSSVTAETINALRTYRRDLAPSGWLPLAQRYVLIAGCRDEESSYEHRSDGSGVAHGALTYFLLRELATASAGSTYRDVFERASAQVTAVYARQHPQMEGMADHELFGMRDIAPMRFVRVQRRSGMQATLAAGAAHGVMAGSRWTVYPAGTKQATAETPRLGTLEVTTVGGVTAEGHILTEIRPSAIAQGTRAIEEAHAFGELRLKVDLQAHAGYEQAVAALDETIKPSSLLRRVSPNEAADARIYLLGPRVEVRPDAHVPQLGAIDVATWAVVGPDGRLLMPPHPVAEPGAPGIVRENLEKITRYRQVLALRNPDIDSALRGQIGLTLKRKAPNGLWVEAPPEAAGGHVYLTEGDHVAIELANRHTDPVYISILDFGLTGRIALFYPAGPSEALASGQTITLGVRQGGEIQLFMPERFPYTPDPTDAAPDGGIETLKVIATTQPADFTWLQQMGVRGDEELRARGVGEGSDTAIGQLLRMTLMGWGTREARINRLGPSDDWTTVERSFYLRRRQP